jgi:hypothetical protein
MSEQIPDSAGRSDGLPPDGDDIAGDAPGDDEEWPEHFGSVPPPLGSAGPDRGGIGSGAPGSGGGGSRGRRHVLAAAVVAVLAAAAGAAMVLIFAKASAATPSAVAPRSTPPVSAGPVPRQGPPPPGARQGGTVQYVIGGKVLAVSGSSITIGGPGRELTAAITSSTSFTGRVRSAGGIKVGDVVTAQISGNGSRLVATAIQDPAQLP